MKKIILAVAMLSATYASFADDPKDREMVQYQINTCRGFYTITAPRLGNKYGEYSPLCAKLHEIKYNDRTCADQREIEDLYWKECQLRKKTIFK